MFEFELLRIPDLAAAVETVPGRTVIDEFEALWDSICTPQKPAPDGFEEDAASSQLRGGIARLGAAVRGRGQCE